MTDSAMLSDKHLSIDPNMPSLEGITRNRDLWCKVAGERLDYIGRLKESLDAMRRERDEARGEATFATAVDGGKLSRLRAELAEAVASRDAARRAFEELLRATDEDEDEDDLDDDDFDDIDDEDLDEDDDEDTSDEDFDREYSSTPLPPDFRPASTLDLAPLGSRLDMLAGRLDAFADRVRELDRIGERRQEEASRKIANLEALIRNLNQQIEWCSAKFDHPKLVSLLRPANGEPASWIANIQTKEGT